jgi:hypothetical protein
VNKFSQKVTCGLIIEKALLSQCFSVGKFFFEWRNWILKGFDRVDFCIFRVQYIERVKSLEREYFQYALKE